MDHPHDPHAASDPNEPADLGEPDGPVAVPKSDSVPHAYAAGGILTRHLERCAKPAGPRADAKQIDDDRRTVLGMLEVAWNANPGLSLGQVLERAINTAGGPGLDRVSDVAMIHALAIVAQPAEPF